MLIKTINQMEDIYSEYLGRLNKVEKNFITCKSLNRDMEAFIYYVSAAKVTLIHIREQFVFVTENYPTNKASKLNRDAAIQEVNNNLIKMDRRITNLAEYGLILEHKYLKKKYFRKLKNIRATINRLQIPVCEKCYEDINIVDIITPKRLLNSIMNS